MPRKPRFVIPGVPMHIVQRGHNRDPVFYDEQDYLVYLGFLKEASDRYGCAIHAYVLMTNHIHILATPESKDSVTRMMQHVGRRYVPYVNHTYGSSGSIWEGRYKASLVQDEEYLLTCMRYIELNPVRANMVRTAAHYRWSSYRFNGQGKGDELLKPHSEYLALSADSEVRREAYKILFKSHLDSGVIDDIRSAWQTGTPYGNDQFRERVEKKLGCKVGQSRRGRPRLPKLDKDEMV